MNNVLGKMLLAGIVMLTATSGALGQFLSVDFQHTTTSAPGVTQSGFSPFDETDSNPLTFTTSQGDVSVTIGSKDADLSGFFTRGGLSNSGAFTFADLYNDFVFDNGSSGEDLTLSLSGPGIDADSDYLLTFFSFDPLSTQGDHEVTISPTSGTTGDPLTILWSGSDVPTSNEEFAATGIFQSNGLGQLNFLLTDQFSGATQTAGIRLNGFQIAATAVPEPISLPVWILAAGVALGALRIVRRRRA